MKLFVVRRHQQVKEDAACGPRLILERGRGWADEALPDQTAYETLFDLYLDEGGPGGRRLLGSTKILQRGRPRVTLPREQGELPEDCCSLGQTIDYYEALEKLGEPLCAEVLRVLRDVTANEDIARAFEGERGFVTSLLRFSEAARIFHNRPRRLHRESPAPSRSRLRFRTTLPGFTEHHALDLDLDPAPGRVGRLIALIGKNGTGKTNLLARLAFALWGLRKQGQEELHIEGAPPGRVIAVSYSALDAFERPPFVLAGAESGDARPAMDNYRYCGFRRSDGALDPGALFAGLSIDLAEIQRLGRLGAWKKMVTDARLAEAEPDLAEAVESTDAVQPLLQAAAHLGAGHKTVLSALTRVLASLRNGALLLLDEPELNLHPALLAALLRVVHGWLDDFDGYGIIATHSPIVLQEIPGRNVYVLRRFGRVPRVDAYDAESFGQSLSEIAGEVFGLDERDKNYLTELRALVASGKTPEEIESGWGRPLSLGARIALRALKGGERA